MKQVAIAALAFLTLAGANLAASAETTANPKVLLTTSAGQIEIELDAENAPATVKNFLEYVDAGAYDGTIFHRVIGGFMIQGGGFQPGMKETPTRAPINNEADNGLKNLAGTIAMARTADPHSASAEFFINTGDNAHLDHRDKSTEGWGYAVFGKVTTGMDTVLRIEAAPTRNAGKHEGMPVTDIVITSVERVTEK
jgi:cyclophilin family peptidyl-prolyl cis-trans isomerase